MDYSGLEQPGNIMDTGISTPVASAVATGLIGLVGIPAYRAFGRHFGPSKSSYESLDQLYEDDDGEATEETQEAYSTTMPRSISLIAVVAGMAIAVVQAVIAMIGVISTSTTGGSWLRVAAWALGTVQAVATFIERDYVHRYALGIYASLASFLVLVSCVVAIDPLAESVRPGELRTALLLAQGALASVAWIAFLCIQRRPDVFSDGRAVDGEMTTSLLGRLSFSWVISLIRKAEKEKQVEYTDLPQLKRRIRAELLSKRFEGATKYSKLWKTVFVAFRHAIGLQVTIVTMKSILQFVPQYAMLKILEILEAPENPHTVSVWAWACLLGGVLVLNTVFIENWLFWVVWTELGIPIRNMLSTLVFQKSIRRKDVKGVSKKKEPAHEVNAEGHPTINLDAGTPGQSTALPANNVEEVKEEAANDEEVEQKSRQTTINLVGVDASRVAMFLTYAYFYPGTIGQIVISVIFLGRLIGAIPLLVGLACFLISIPLNWWASRNYARLQDTIMSLRDKKLAIANEALQGIRQIKFSALESQWQSKLRDRRELELQALWSAALYDTVIIACYIGSPNLLMAGALATYASLHGELTPSVAFTTVAILTALEAALSVLPELTTEGIEAFVSINRIEDYLNAPEIVDSIEPSDQIRFEDAHIAWPADDQEADPDRFVLRKVNFMIPPKELTVISGKTGSGKSLLLASLLGEIDKLSGKIYAPKAPRPADRYDSKATRGNWIIDSATAFVAQVPWIENATLKDNILFGLPCDEGRYKKTLEACALTKDMEMLDDGDLTEIGHNGVNLSGGQRWRVSFARALYSRAGILVLDDVFSAVDAHVGRQLFEEALTGELAHGRTRVLVTHHVSLVLPKTRYAIYLADGTVKYAGFVEDLRQAGHLEALMEDNVSPSDSNSDDSDTEVGEPLGPALSKVMSRRSQRSAVIDDGGASSKKDAPKKFVEDEKRETGAIKAIVYRTYFIGSGGLWLWLPIFSMYVLTQLFEVGKGWWVTVWTDSYKTQAETHSETFPFHSKGILQHAMHANNQTRGTPDNSLHSDTVFYLTVYVVLSFAAVAFGAIKYLATFVAGLRASRKLFENLTFTVLRTPLRWVDTVPVGRILNRFTADFNTIDSGLAGHMGFFMYKVTETAGITGVSFVTSPYMIPLTLVLMLSAAYIGSRFIVGARSVKRLENNAKSPIFELFGSVLTGIATVRGYAKDEEYIERMWKRIDEHGRSFWNLWLMNRWMGFRFALIGAFFSFCVAVVIASADVPASLAGFALAFALQYADAIIWVLRAYAALELDMTAAERVIEFSSLEIESQGGKEAPAAWPSKGRLEVDDLVVGYSPDLPPVLKGISFKADSGERVGVVGRTGAGKSSLTLALFRFLEARQGTVLIDGIDISTLTLHSLRSRLAIIPQDPVLFSGTVRSNLDPFDQHADHELRDALERVHLVSSSSTRPSTAVNDAPAEDTNTNIFKSLASRISEGGLNLSQGQRQLLCLARAIVARPRLMVLDEATSAVDKDTDTLIQRSIRDEFAGSTLVVIAHRLSTIADFDRILVLGEGRVVEFGTPRELLQKPEGAFREMVAQSGECEALEETIMGQNEDAN